MLCCVLCVSVAHREETEIIEGEVVEVQIDRPTSASVSGVCVLCVCVSDLRAGSKGRKADTQDN